MVSWATFSLTRSCTLLGKMCDVFMKVHEIIDLNTDCSTCTLDWWVSEWSRSVVSDSLRSIPWTVDYQASPSMGFSRQECWTGLPFPSPGDLSDPGIESRSPALWADTLLFESPGKLIMGSCMQLRCWIGGDTLKGWAPILQDAFWIINIYMGIIIILRIPNR